MGCGCSSFNDYDNCTGCTGCPGSHDNFGDKSRAWYEKNKGTIEKVKGKISEMKNKPTDMPVDTTLDQPEEKSNKTILAVAVIVIAAIAIYYFNTKK